MCFTFSCQIKFTFLSISISLKHNVIEKKHAKYKKLYHVIPPFRFVVLLVFLCLSKPSNLHFGPNF